MNRNDLEKILDDKIWLFSEEFREEVKSIVFETIIPEVLKEFMPYSEDAKYGFKRKAKSFYGIEL